MSALLLLYALFSGMLQAPDNIMPQNDLNTYVGFGAPFDYVLIDVRKRDEIKSVIGSKTQDYDCGLIAVCRRPGCKPYNFPWPKEFKKMVPKLPKDMTVIVYCQDGKRSAEAAAYLRENGYAKVYNAGGMMTWTGEIIPPSKIMPASKFPQPSSYKWPENK
jgi:rhodanese-related sulfurtransferase